MINEETLPKISKSKKTVYNHTIPTIYQQNYSSEESDDEESRKIENIGKEENKKRRKNNNEKEMKIKNSKKHKNNSKNKKSDNLCDDTNKQCEEIESEKTVLTHKKILKEFEKLKIKHYYSKIKNDFHSDLLSILKKDKLKRNFFLNFSDLLNAHSERITNIFTNINPSFNFYLNDEENMKKVSKHIKRNLITFKRNFEELNQFENQNNPNFPMNQKIVAFNSAYTSIKADFIKGRKTVDRLMRIQRDMLIELKERDYEIFKLKKQLKNRNLYIKEMEKNTYKEFMKVRSQYLKQTKNGNKTTKEKKNVLIFNWENVSRDNCCDLLKKEKETYSLVMKKIKDIYKKELIRQENEKIRIMESANNLMGLQEI